MLAELGLAILPDRGGAVAAAAGGRRLALTPRGRLAGLVRPVAVVQGLLAALAFAALIMLFVNTDLSVKLVAENSHSAKPLIYKVAEPGATTKARCCCG